MRIDYLRAALVCLALTLAAPSATAAQDEPPQTPPAAPVEAPERLPRRLYQSANRILQDYTLRRGDSVRQVQVVFGDAVIDGRVDYDVVVTMGSARLGPDAVIGQSLVVIGGSARIDEGAEIGGDLVVVGGTLNAPPGFSPGREYVVVGAPWAGEVLRDVSPWMTRGLLFGRLIVPDLDWVWIVVAVFFLVYLALNTVFDGAIGATADLLVERPMSAFVTGLLVLILAAPVLAIIAATVIGIAVVPFLLCGIIVAGLVGKTAVARAIGRGITRVGTPEGRIAAFLAFTLGFVLLVLAYMVPVLGFITWAVGSVVGLGAATTTFRGHLRRERRPAAPAAQDAAPLPAASPVPPPPVATPYAAEVRADIRQPSEPAVAIPAPPPPPPPVLPPPPPPAFTQGLAQYPRATFLDRVAAFVLDCILVAIANGLLDMSRNDGFFFLLLLGYHIGFWAWRGTTLGGIICSLRVTRTDGNELRPVDAIVRGLASIFSIAALGIGCLWMLQDSERQMWHDKIAGTLVVKVPREVVLP